MKNSKQILFLLIAVFIAGIGLGITLPVLPFYAETLMLGGNKALNSMSWHITGLTSVYALMQFIFAPAWGGMSDKFGRKRIICIGIFGTAVSQVFFGLSASITQLYGARILGGILSASLAPAATAYVADLSDDSNRSRHMAWLGTVSSLATVAGIAFGGLFTSTSFNLLPAPLGAHIAPFAVPFLAAAIVIGITGIAAWRWLPESDHLASKIGRHAVTHWRNLLLPLAGLLAVGVIGQVALTGFEATFPLFAQSRFAAGPRDIGIGFMVCGLVMSIFQVVAVGFFARHMLPAIQLSVGFGLMAIGLFMVSVVPNFSSILGSIAVVALGMAFIAPNLAALAAKGRGTQTGAALGALSAATSLGQTAGPLLGGLLYGWRSNAPFAVGALTMLLMAGCVGRWMPDSQSLPLSKTV